MRVIIAMAQQKDFTALTDDFKWEPLSESRVSAVVSMLPLPVSIQSWITPLPSIRKRLSLRSLQAGSWAYSRHRTLSEADASMISAEKVNYEAIELNRNALIPTTGNSSPTLYAESASGEVPLISITGISWKFACQGKSSLLVDGRYIGKHRQTVVSLQR